MLDDPKCKFDFDVPRGYSWLLEHQLIGYEPFSRLQPWHYLNANQCFVLNERWPNQSPGCERLVAFAKRQDTDDLACFAVNGRRVDQIYLVHGWTPNGYEVDANYPDFWNWLKAIIDDIAEWAEESSG